MVGPMGDRAHKEVVSAAKSLARRGLTGKRGDPLPAAMSTEATAWINSNLALFKRLVRHHSHEKGNPTVNRHHKGKTYRLSRKPMFGKSAYVVELVATGQALGYRMARKDAEELAKSMGLRKARASKPAAKRNPKKKSMRPGGGGRFKKCVKSVTKRGRVGKSGAKAICAAAGRRKYGAKKMAKMAKVGAKRAARNPGGLTAQQARTRLRAVGASIPGDFHVLRSSQVDHLTRQADLHKYRAPKNASGSRGRYWHDYLQRRAASGAKVNPKRKVARKKVTHTGKHWLTDRTGRPIGSRTGYPSLSAAKDGAAIIRRRSQKIIKVFRGPRSYMQSNVWGGQLAA